MSAPHTQFRRSDSLVGDAGGVYGSASTSGLALGEGGGTDGGGDGEPSPASFTRTFFRSMSAFSRRVSGFALGEGGGFGGGESPPSFTSTLCSTSKTSAGSDGFARGDGGGLLGGGEGEPSPSRGEGGGFDGGGDGEPSPSRFNEVFCKMSLGLLLGEGGGGVGCGSKSAAGSLRIASGLLMVMENGPWTSP